MNKLASAKRAEILGMMVEGVSLRAISRLTGASKNTIVKLLADAGEAFSDYQDRTLRNLPCKRMGGKPLGVAWVQRIACKEIMSFAW